jgi:peroxidase
MKFDYTLGEYRSIDGTGNNELDGSLGAAGQDFLRLADADYADGVSTPAGGDRPSAREISNAIFDEPVPIAEPYAVSDYLWAWGQFIDHDIDIAGGGGAPESFNIQVPTGDPHFDQFGTGAQEIELTRTGYNEATGTDTDNPREQVNEITAFLDASMVYGSDADRAEFLRDAGGKLKVSPGDYLPYNDGTQDNAGGPSTDLFVAGDVRANETTSLSTLHTLFVREHNRLVEEIADQRPEYTDEQLYQEAKAIVEAEIQAITYNDFLPLLLGQDGLAEYSGYKPDIDPGISNMFATAAYRVGHTMLSSEIQRQNEDGSESASGNLQLRDAFFRPGAIVDEGGLDPILRGLADGKAHKIDSHVVDDVRNFLFGPPGAGGFDLVSLNIQRGRDHGLASYNDAREAYGLDRVTSFDQITADVELQGILSDLYGTVDDIDPWVGGLVEDRTGDAMVGEFFLAVLADQFTRMRDGDRFWYEERFTGETLAELQNLSLADIIERNTDIDHIQDEIFFAYDRIGGTDSNDTLGGGSGRDLMIGFDGDDTLRGKDGNDQLFGDAGKDKLYGQNGNDILEGGDGADRMFGGKGDDLLKGDAGNDRMDGDAGNDRMYGGDGNDTMYGDGGNDVMMGDAGNDSLYGNGGDDDIAGGAGNDRIKGGTGNDMADGGDGNDTLYGYSGNDTLLGGAGNDRLYGQNGNDILEGGDGADRMFGGNGDDELNGGAGNDRIDGDRGNDTMNGGDGNDTMYGDGGNDILNGGTGNDRLYGNGGDDYFVFTDDFGDDLVFGFTSGADTIDLSALMITADDLEISRSGNHTIVEIDGLDDTITLVHVRPDALDIDDDFFLA